MADPIAWIVKWTTVHTPENASAYLNEADAKRAAANVKMYAHASNVVVIPAYAAPPPSHLCSEAECPYNGKPSGPSCRCHAAPSPS